MTYLPISRRTALKGTIAISTFSWGLLGCGGGGGSTSAENPAEKYDFSALKQVALEAATIKKEQTETAGLSDEANALQADIAALENVALTAPATPNKAIGFYPQPKILTANPHLDALYAWAETQLTGTAMVYKKATTTAAVFPNGSYNETRALVGTAERLIWLVLSPVSQYRYNPELFKRLLLLAYATSDDYLVNGGSIPDNNGLDDWFAAPGAAYSWRILDEACTGFVPNLLLERMRLAADKMGGVFYGRSLNEMKAQAPYDTYCNRDISFAEVMMHTGMHRGNDLWIERAKLVTDLMIGPTVLYADGGYAYIGNQNESANYHGGTTTSLGNLYAVTGNPAILAALSKVSNYELLNVEQGFVNEFYTVPAWKTAWNTGDGVSYSFMSYISQSPHWQTFANVRSRVIATSSNVLDSAFYTAPITGKPLVDNYLVYDRNIQGPRYRRNHFSYAMTTRKVSLPNSMGALTLVGAMTTQADPTAGTSGSSRRHLSDALMSVHAKVHTNAGTATEWDTWSYLIGDTNPQTTMSRTIGAVSTPCTLYRQTAGPTGHASNWQSFQQWLALPDRLIGIVEVYPQGGTAQNAYEIDGRIKLGYGRSGTRFPKTLQTITAGKEYVYGNLRVLVHAHDFTMVDTALAGVIRDSPLDATEIRFRYFISGTDGTTNVSFPGNTRKFFLVEIREKAVTTPITVARHDAAGVKGIIVSEGDNRYGVFRNLTVAEVSLGVSAHVMANLRTTIHYPRDDGGVSISPTQFSGTTLTIPANEQRLLISSASANDHEPCWAHYDELLTKLPALTILTEGTQSNACTTGDTRFVALTQNMGAATTFQWRVNDIAVDGATEAQFSPVNLTKGQRVNCMIDTTLDNGSPYSLKSNTIVALCTT
jgi:hypothetical protein